MLTGEALGHIPSQTARTNSLRFSGVSTALKSDEGVVVVEGPATCPPGPCRSSCLQLQAFHVPDTFCPMISCYPQHHSSAACTTHTLLLIFGPKWEPGESCCARYATWTSSTGCVQCNTWTEPLKSCLTAANDIIQTNSWLFIRARWEEWIRSKATLYHKSWKTFQIYSAIHYRKLRCFPKKRVKFKSKHWVNSLNLLLSGHFHIHTAYVSRSRVNCLLICLLNSLLILYEWNYFYWV